jgi:PTH2 family peptidyl-tRNA hydrolase
MIKQVIVMRRDLKLRRGKEIAQGAHAAMAFLTNRLYNASPNGPDFMPPSTTYKIHFTEDELSWVKGEFTKICVQVNSEQELQDIYDIAKIANLTVNMITDSGHTEFNGVPTKTCLAIGPNKAEDIDRITGHLRLY